MTPVVFLTERGARHQRIALKTAPDGVSAVVLRDPAPETLAAALATARVLVSERSVPVPAAMLDLAPHLELIVRLGSLTHDVAIAAARARGIRVSVQPVPLCAACAEHALLLTLALLRRLVDTRDACLRADHGREARRTDEDTFAYNWLERRDLGTVSGSRIAILGMGEIGVELARRLRAFGPAQVRYHKRRRYPEAVERELGIAWGSWEACLEAADVVVSLLPYSASTDGALGEAAFARMRPGAWLVHVGSGSVVDEDALLRALRSGRLSGAALDTFAYEPLSPSDPLLQAAREPGFPLLLTPHTAAVGPATVGGDWDEVARHLRGEPLRHAVA